MSLDHSAVRLDSCFLVRLRPTGLNARHAAKFSDALLNILRENSAASVGLYAAHLDLSVNEQLRDALLDNLNLAVIANDSVHVEVRSIR